MKNDNNNCIYVESLSAKYELFCDKGYTLKGDKCYK